MLNSEFRFKQIISGATFVFLGFIIGKFFLYLTRIIIVRKLGIEIYGLFSLSLAITGITTILSLLGFNQSVARFISYFKCKNENEKIKGILVFSLKLTLFLSILLSFCLFLISDILSIFFNQPSLSKVIRAFILIIPFSVLMNILIAAIRGFQEIKYKFLIEDFVKNTLILSFLILFLYMNYDILGVIIAYILGTIISTALAFFYLNKIFPIKKINTVNVSKEMIKFTWPLTIVTFLGLILSWTDTILIGYFRNMYDVGIYNISLTASVLILIGLDSVMYIFMPIISEIYSSNGISEYFKKIYKIVAKWIFLITFPITLTMIIFSKNIISLLFGQEYISAAFPMIILSIGFLIHSITNVSAGSITAIGKTRVNLIVSLISAITNLLSNFFLIQHFGILGAAFGTSLSYIVMGLTNLFYGYKLMKLHPFSLKYTKSIFSAIISTIIIYFLVKLIIKIYWWSLIIIIPLFLLIYGTILLITKFFEAEDIIIMQSIEKRIGIKFKILRNLIKKFLF